MESAINRKTGTNGEVCRDSCVSQSPCYYITTHKSNNTGLIAQETKQSLRTLAVTSVRRFTHTGRIPAELRLGSNTGLSRDTVATPILLIGSCACWHGVYIRGRNTERQVLRVFTPWLGCVPPCGFKTPLRSATGRPEASTMSRSWSRSSRRRAAAAAGRAAAEVPRRPSPRASSASRPGGPGLAGRTC